MKSSFVGGLALRLVAWLNRHYLAVAIVTGLIVFGFIFLLPKLVTTNESQISVTGSAQPPANLDVKVNGTPAGRISFSSQPQTEQIEYDGKVIKRVDLVPEGSAGTQISLSRFEISTGGAPLVLSGKDLGALRTRGVTSRVDSGGLEMRLTERPPNISEQPVTPQRASESGPASAIQGWLEGSSTFSDVAHIWVIVLAFGLATVFVTTSRVLLVGAAAFGTYVVTSLAFDSVPDVLNPGPPVDTAVGASSYFGTPFAGGQLTGWMTLIGILVLAVALRVYLVRTKQGPEPATGPVIEARRSDQDGSSTSSWWFDSRRSAIVFGVWAAASLTLIPTLGSFDTSPLSPQWDSANGSVWTFFVNNGLTPMKDFWYPYGYRWLFNLVPLGPLWFWLTNSALLASAAWSFWRLSGKSVGRTVACVVVIVLLGLFGGLFWRYLPGFLIPLSYAAVGPARWQRPQRAHLVVFATFLLAGLLEADLLLYGLVGAALVLFGDLLFGYVRFKVPTLLRALVVDATPLIGAAVVLLLIWVAEGSASGNLDWIGRLSDVAAYGGTNQEIAGTLSQ